MRNLDQNEINSVTGGGLLEDAAAALVRAAVKVAKEAIKDFLQPTD